MQRGRRANRFFAALMATLALGSVVGAAAAGAATTVSSGRAVLGPPIVGAPGAWPGSGGGQGTWQAWAANQRSAIESTPWSQELAAQGKQLLNVAYEPVSQVPGLPIPPGETTTAAVLTFKETGPPTAASAASTGILPLNTGGCAAITSGTACITGAPVTGGYAVYASYAYWGSGSVDGHVELGIGGCPGTAVVNGPNEVLTYGVGQQVVYGPVFSSAYWSSTYWYFYGSGYSDWGSACSELS